MRLTNGFWRAASGALAGAALIAVLASLPLDRVDAQRKGKKGGGPGMPDPISHDAAGFTPIFDGKSLEGWDGDPEHWRVEDGMIVGESTAENPLELNTFLIWRDGRPADFELVVEYRINATNSGVQYRSVELPDVGQWVLKGYQADIDAQNTYTGQIYEERGRGFLALRGQLGTAAAGQKPRVLGEIGDNEALKAKIKVDDWNRLHIIARGNTLVQILNDQLMSEFIDDDPVAGSRQGLIGVQLHRGPPMKIEVRNVLLKVL